MKRNRNVPGFLFVVLVSTLLSTAAPAAPPEQGMFGHTPARNMASDETGLPAEWDIEAGRNVKWSAEVGSQSYAGPVIFGGKVFVGTNNEGKRNQKLTGDRGVVMAFQESDGTFLWQMTHEKLESGEMDWPLQGVCSTPTVEGDRLYYVSNRAELVAIDTEGFRDGENDGSFQAEKATSEIDGDVVWAYDMIAELEVVPHNMAVGAPVVVGDLVFAPTSNGVEGRHGKVPSPHAPSFIAVNKSTGKLVWKNAAPGANVLHGAWSNPAYGTLGGKAQVIFAGGDGWLYSLEPETGKEIWKFDCNPKDAQWKAGGYGNRNNIISTPVIYDGKVYIGVGQDPEHGDAPGNFWAVDPSSGSGEVTEKAKVWNRGGEEFNRTLSTAAIHDDVVYISDLAGFLYALNAHNGEHYWTYDAFAAVWGSPFVADGKVYLGDEDGEIAVLKAGKKMEVLGELYVGSAVYSTPVAHDGVLFVLSRKRLFALAGGDSPKAEKPPAEAGV
ncbi:MAG: PQQ-binding-like beta-propeller repeat protein [bacterium]|nr:PQQ-binding-like beta-propeller repeat protein [bacterium]